MTEPQTPYEILGDDGIKQLASAFYDVMEELPQAAEVRAMHAENLDQIKGSMPSTGRLAMENGIGNYETNAKWTFPSHSILISSRHLLWSGLPTASPQLGRTAFFQRDASVAANTRWRMSRRTTIHHRPRHCWASQQWHPSS